VAPSTPLSNELPPGLLEKDIIDAITESGYPLQTKVAASLLSHGFDPVDEEWPYIDSDTHQTREIDLRATKSLEGTELEPMLGRSGIEPMLNLMFECKQSTLPYVFFLCQRTPWIDHFPIMAGLPGRFVFVDMDPAGWITPIVNALGVNGPEVSHEFMKKPSCCLSFSKCVRSSKRIELSGTEAYNSLVLPLIKAMQHFEEAMLPKGGADPKIKLTCMVTLGIGVLDAPIIGVRPSAEDSGPHIIRLPWVRVARRGAIETPLLDENKGTFGIDVVHKDFLDEYLSEHVLPFFLDLSRSAIQHSKIMRTGTGFGVMDDSGRIELKRRRARPERIPFRRA